MNPNDPKQLKPYIVEALRGNTHQHFSIIWNYSRKRGFWGDGDQTPNIVQFFQLHQDRLIKELKSAAVTLHWNEWDQDVLVTIVPEKGDPEEKFRKFTLPFPPRKPALVK